MNQINTKERPILFSAPMVRALLSGIKTQTRRIVNPQPHAGMRWNPVVLSGNAGWEDGHGTPLRCPYGQPGDRLWVREAFRFPQSLDRHSPAAVGEAALDAGYRDPWSPTQYEADGHRTNNWIGFETPPIVSVPGKQRPGIHMPRWASRILLEIVNVRAERLQDISEVDALAEGVKSCEAELHNSSNWYCPEELYSMLWTKINGWEGNSCWNANPWVWVVEFRRIEP
jgi:hypothetical protein